MSNSNAVRGGLWFALGQLVPMFLTAVLSVVAAGTLGPERLGAQSFIAYVTAFVMNLTSLTLTTTSLRTVSATWVRGDRRERRNALAFAGWNYAAVAAGQLLVLSTIGLIRGVDRLSWGLAAANAALNALVWLFSLRGIATDGYSRFSKRMLLTQILSQTIGVAGLLLGGEIWVIFLGNIVATVIQLVLTLVGERGGRLGAHRAGSRQPAGPPDPVPATEPPGRTPSAAGPVAGRSRGNPPRRGPGRHLPARIEGFYGIWGLLILVEVINQVVIQRSEFVILDRWGTQTDIALFSVLLMLVLIATALPVALAQASMPRIAAAVAAGRDVTAAFARVNRLVLVLAVLAASGMAAVGPQAILVLYREDFRPAADLVPFAALAVLTIPLQALAMQYWAAVGRLRAVVALGLVAAVVKLAAALAIIPAFGLAGALVVYLIGQVCLLAGQSGLTWWRLGRYDLAPGRFVGLLVPCALVAAAGHLLVARLQGVLPGWLTLLVALAATGAALLIACLVLRPIRADDADWIGGSLPAAAGPLLRRASR